MSEPTSDYNVFPLPTGLDLLGYQMTAKPLEYAGNAYIVPFDPKLDGTDQAAALFYGREPRTGNFFVIRVPLADLAQIIDFDNDLPDTGA